jgi:nicotinamidase/pyrazinamidase
MKRALIVVDVQNDFCEGGSAPVPGGAEVAYRIGELLHHWSAKDLKAPEYDVALATREHHLDAHSSHCVAGTDGEALHPNLDPQPFDAVFLKGEHRPAQSGFEGHTTDGVQLADWLRRHEVTDVDVCGVPVDCVRATALDAVTRGFTVRVLTELVAGVTASDGAMEEVRSAGAVLV